MKKLLFAILVGTLFVTGCGDHAADTSDPKQVAEAFWRAIIAKDYESARQHVIPKDRKDFVREKLEKELAKLPPLPDSAIVEVEINGDEGEALLENWEFKDGVIEMIKKDGRWWVEK